jgi:hypothetical protein
MDCLTGIYFLNVFATTSGIFVQAKLPSSLLVFLDYLYPHIFNARGRNLITEEHLKYLSLYATQQTMFDINNSDRSGKASAHELYQFGSKD